MKKAAKYRDPVHPDISITFIPVFPSAWASHSPGVISELYLFSRGHHGKFPYRN
jgi:hypothetical protein